MIPRHLQITFGFLLVGIFGASAYMLNLRNKAADVERRNAASMAVEAPVSGAEEAVTLYIVYDDDGVVRKRAGKAVLPAEATARGRAILRRLLQEYLQKSSSHPLGEGSDVNDIFIVNNALAVINLNSAFAAKHRSGVWVESMTIDSLVATLAANMPAIKQVKILVDDRERETLAGHADLTSIYEVAQVNQLMQALQ